MDSLQLKQVSTTKTGVLIRKPVADVVEALVNPDITTKYWFTKSGGRLEAGKQVQWDWEMYGISIPVTVKAVEPNRRVVVEWQGGSSPTAAMRDPMVMFNPDGSARQNALHLPSARLFAGR